HDGAPPLSRCRHPHSTARPPAGQYESGCAEQKPVERGHDGPKRKAPRPWGRGGSERITGCECSTRAVYSIRKRVSTSLLRKQAAFGRSGVQAFRVEQRTSTSTSTSTNLNA